jgi:UDP-N-acetylglucosamine 2-epimerase (non-hydrolysing)
MKKVMVVFGTRPEAIKMCPVIIELKKVKTIKTIVTVTGQHREMLDQVLEIFGVAPDYDLEIMANGQTLFDITEKVMDGLNAILKKEMPDIVIVHGDTTTSFAAALSAFYMNIKIAHVEAGLRTYDTTSPYPEEFNRHAVGIIADYNFAPTERAKQNLIKEGRKEDTIWVTGNTVIDALKTTVQKDFVHPELEWCKGYRMALITAHRRENLGEPMREIFKGIKRVLDEHDDVRAIYPVHLNPKVRKICKEVFEDDERIHLIEPLDVFDFHNFMNAAYLILTDSGGIQEEAPSLGKPVLVLRTTTERPEGVEVGTVKLTGVKEEQVYCDFKLLLDDEDEYQKMSKAINPFGDGHASERIAEILIKYI